MKRPYEILADKARTYESKPSHHGLIVPFGTRFFKSVSVDSELIKCTFYFIGEQDSEQTSRK